MNWKTAAAGAAAILGALSHALYGYANDDYSGIPADLVALATGVGLVFAKDHDVTGGTRSQGYGK